MAIKRPVTVMLDDSTLGRIDKKRGGTPRSLFIRGIVERAVR
jgi:hypothetical protein